MEHVILTADEKQTIQAGINFSHDLKPQDIVFLHGHLGSGKTTFTKGIAKGLGVESRIISPTFVVARSHRANKGNITSLYHLDLYRLADEKELKEIDLEEFLQDLNGVTVIEWPEVGQHIINKKVWHVTFEMLENEGRKIKVSYE